MSDQDQIDSMLDSIDPRVSGWGASQPSGGAQPAPVMSDQDQIDQMLDSIDPRVSGWGPPKGAEQPEETSATGAAVRGFERNLPAAGGGLAAGAYGAELGAGLGTAIGGPIGGTIGGIGGGLAGWWSGASAVDAGRNWVVSKLPEGVQSYLGGTEKEQQEDYARHGLAADLGGTAAYALTLRPDVSSIGRMAAGGLALGGITLGQEAMEGQLDKPRAWWNVAVNTGFGAFFNKPNILGEAIESRLGAAGARTGQAITGRSAPTVAEAGDLKVLGPGITEGVHAGTEEMASEAEVALTKTAQAEGALLGKEPPGPDVHDVARKMYPDLFTWRDGLIEQANSARSYIESLNPSVSSKYNALSEAYWGLDDRLKSASEAERADILRRQNEIVDQWATLDEHTAVHGAGTIDDTGDALAARARLREANDALDDMQDQIQAAYRRAADYTGGETAEPEPAAAPGQSPKPEAAATAGEARPPETPPQPASTAIADDVRKRLIGAGVSMAQAQERGVLEQAFFDTLASRGNFGTAQELYEQHGPIWRRAGQGAPSEATPFVERPTRQRAGRPQTLRAFLKAKGGLRDDFGDLKHIGLLRGYPGLISKKGMTLDRARETAAQAGYFGPVDEATANTTIADFLDALRKDQHYAPEDQNAIHEKEMAAQAEQEEVRIQGNIDHFADEHGIKLDPELRERVTYLLNSGELHSVDDAIERAAIQLEHEEDERAHVAGGGKTVEEIRGAAENGEGPGEAGSAHGAQGALRGDQENPFEGVDLFQSAKGKISVAPGRRPLVTLFKDADFSTLIHEGAHNYLDILNQYAQHPEASPALRQDWQTIKDWLRLKDGEPIRTAQHERFARGFEQYIRAGIAPSPRLAGAFAKFKQWMMAIYQTIRGLGRPISDEIRGVFDRMLAETPQRAVIAPEIERGPTLPDIHEADAAETPPQGAEAAMDRVTTERDRAIEEHQPDVRAEFEPRRAPQPGAEGGEGEVGARPVGEPGGGPESQPGGGARGETSIPEQRGGGEVGREGAGLAGNESGGAGTRKSAGNAIIPRPARVWERPGTGAVDKAGNIVLRNVTPENFGQVLVESAERNDEFKAVRGNMTKRQIWDVSTELALGPQSANFEEKLARIVGSFEDLAPKALALRRLVRQSAQDVWALANVAARSQSDADTMKLAQAISRHDMIQSALSGATASWGRTGSAFHSLRSFPQGADLGQVLKDATGRELYQLKMMSKMIAGFERGAEADMTAQLSKFVKDSGEYSFGRMILEYWTNALISGIPRHVTYLAGNLFSMAAKNLVDVPTAAAIGAVRKSFGREGERIHLGEVGARLRGAREGLAPALTGSIDALRTGQAVRLPGQTPDMGIDYGVPLTAAESLKEGTGFRDTAHALYALGRGLKDGTVVGGAIAKGAGGAQYSLRGAIPNFRYLPLGDIARLPGRMVAAFHSFFSGLGYSIEANGLEFRQVMNELEARPDWAGMSPEQKTDLFNDRVAVARNNRSPELMEAASKNALEGALMGPGGSFMRAISNAVNHEFEVPWLGKTQLLRFIDPFVKIGGNLTRQTLIDRTVLGLLDKSIRDDILGVNGNAAQDLAMARMAVGTAAATLVGVLASEGLITGGGPKDPKQRDVWLQDHQPYSVDIGGYWIQLNRLGPFGMLAGASADLYHVAQFATEGEMMKAGAALLNAITHSVLDESFMKGPADLINAIEGRDFNSYLKEQVPTFLPFSTEMGYLAKSTDPYMRQTATILDAIKDRVPGLSESLPAKRDIFGRPIANNRDVTGTGQTAIWARKRSNDPVVVEMLRLGITPSPVEKRIRGVTLTPQQYDDYQRIAGIMTKQRLDQYVRSGMYERSTDAQRRDRIGEIFKYSRETARNQMMSKYPQIPHDATDRRTAHLSGEDIKSVED